MGVSSVVVRQQNFATGGGNWGEAAARQTRRVLGKRYTTRISHNIYSRFVFMALYQGLEKFLKTSGQPLNNP